MSSDTPLLVRSDFSSLNISIGWTVTAKRPGLRALKASDEPKLVEIRDDGATLELPENVCHVGDRVLFQLQAQTPEGNRSNFSSPAQIESVTPVESEGHGRVAVSLCYLLSNPAEWDAFRKILDFRQNEIDAFMKAAKGY